MTVFKLNQPTTFPEGSFAEVAPQSGALGGAAAVGAVAGLAMAGPLTAAAAAGAMAYGATKDTAAGAHGEWKSGHKLPQNRVPKFLQ